MLGVTQIVRGVVSLLLGSMLVLSARHSAPAEAAAQVGSGAITVGIWQEPDYLTWIVGTNCFACTAIMHTLWEPPMEVGEDGSLTPSLLAEVPSVQNGAISADGTQITLKLKPGIKWSDGQPMTMDDFVFTWQLVTNPDTGTISSPGWDNIDSIDVTSATEAVVHLKRPYVPFLAQSLSAHYAPWMPKHAIEGKDFKEWSRAPTVTSGAYTFVEFAGGDHITVQQNPNFMKPASIGRITFKLVTDRSALIAQLKSGELDAGVILNEPDVVSVGNDPNLTVHAAPGLTKEWWSLNQRDPNDRSKPHPILSDLKVRQAIYYALDRKGLTDSLLGGVASVGINFLRGTGYFNQSLQVWPYEPDKARALLDEAGWKDSNGDGIRDKNGVPLKLQHSTTSGNQLREQIQVVLQQNLRDVGIDLEIKNYRAAELFGSFSENGILATGKYDIAQWADGTIGPDPDLSHHYSSKQMTSATNPSGYNYANVSNPALDEALDCQVQTFDVDKRKACLDTMQQIVYDNVYGIFLYDRSDVMISTSKLQGAIHQADADGTWMGNTEDWTLQP